MIYMDNSATTFPKPEAVYHEADKLNRETAFNAGRGSYPSALKAQNILDQARQKVADLAEADVDQVVFTSSATHALNQIIYGLGLKRGDTVYVSPFEHNSIIRPLKAIKGLNVEVLPFDPATWTFDEAKTNVMFKRRPPSAVFTSEVSNVTGYRLPWEAIFKLASLYGATTILDSSQSFGSEQADYTWADLVVFNGHKSLYGIMGVAGWINLSYFPLEPVYTGGTGTDSLSETMPQFGPERYEAGTHNIPAIGSLVPAIDWLKEQNSDHPNHKEELAEYLADNLRKIDSVTVYLPENIKSEGIVSFNLEGYTACELAEILAQDFGFALRSGYHCSPLVHDLIGSKPFLGTVRVSLGYFNTKNEIDQLLQALRELEEEL